MNSEQNGPDTPEQITESTEVVETGAEPVNSVAVVEAMKEGAAHAKSAAAEFVPGIGRLVSKTVYGAFYYASYGVVFGALTVAHLVPTNNLMGHALKDGADAAKQAVAERENLARQAEEDAAPMEEGVVAA